MACGIVPGSPLLDSQDVHLAGANDQESSDSLVSLLLFLGIEKQVAPLLQRLRGRYASMGTPSMEAILANLTELHDNYANDLFCRWNEIIVNLATVSQEQLSTKAGFLQHLQEIHGSTTDYFRANAGNLEYVSLVGAHVAMSFGAYRQALDTWTFSKDKCQDRDGKQGSENMFLETGNVYVDRVPEVVASMRRCGCTLSDVEIEEAWWMLVLRGIVWYLSVWITTPDSFVPSYLYNDHSKVHIIQVSRHDNAVARRHGEHSEDEVINQSILYML